MLGKVKTVALVGLDAYIVDVEVDISSGLPAFTIVGLPDVSIQESRERVRAAIRNSGYNFPPRRITVNLAPAEIRKEGSSYDLPIAIGILLSSEQLSADVSEAVFLGELSLEGYLRPISGVLPMVMLAKDRGFNTVFVPVENAQEASLVQEVRVIPVDSLSSLLKHLSSEIIIKPCKAGVPLPISVEQGVDFAEIKGQEHAKRALEVAASGGHNVIMTGPPGSGKTMLAKALPSILPPLTPEERMEVTKIYSACGLLSPDRPWINSRPFRAPHFTISYAGLVGGGKTPRPGEISLSHRGVLFLDELPQFNPSVLEALRQPLEDKVVTISRAQGSITFPANFMLVGAANPCPCGFFGDPVKPCSCSPALISRYQKRVSGPLLDRIDIFIQIPRVEYDKLVQENPGESSQKIRERVTLARERQLERFKGSKIKCNADMGPVEIRKFCRLEREAQNLLSSAVKSLNLTARAFHRVLKLSRTIADLEGSELIKAYYLAEALQYRPREESWL